MRRINPTDFRIAHRGTSREINRQILLNLVRTRQPVSRAELARLMGVRRGAISRLVQDLLDSHQVFEGAKGDSKRGRKPQHLFIETRQRCALAVDISASRTLVQLTDPLGHPLAEIDDLPTPHDPASLVPARGTSGLSLREATASPLSSAESWAGGREAPAAEITAVVTAVAADSETGLNSASVEAALPASSRSGSGHTPVSIPAVTLVAGGGSSSSERGGAAMADAVMSAPAVTTRTVPETAAYAVLRPAARRSRV